MAEFEMTLAEALALKTHLSALGYPDKRDNELLGLALNTIVRERVAVVRRFDEFKRNTPSEGPSKTKLSASPDADGGPILKAPSTPRSCAALSQSFSSMEITK